MRRGESEFSVNTKARIIVNTILAIFSIYEFVQLSFDGEYDFIYGIISIWLISKLIALILYFTLKKRIGFGYYLTPLILQSEWIMTKNHDNISFLDIAKIYQTIINTFPIVISNIYLLSDTSRNIDHGYYITLIFIYYIFIGMSVVSSVRESAGSSQTIFHNQVYLLFASIPLNFCFWYLLIQSFSYNWIIGVSFLIINLIACIIDILFFEQYWDPSIRNRKIHNILYKILQYQFQYNQVFLTNFTYKFTLSSWFQIFSCTLQCLNVIILQIIKFTYYPLIIETDKAYYSFLVLCLYQFYLLSLNIYHKLTKQNKYHQTLFCKDKEIQIEQKTNQLLSSRFILDYQIRFSFSHKCLEKQNQGQFYKNLQKIKDFMRTAYQTTNKFSQIIVQDKWFEIEIITTIIIKQIFTSQYKECKQTLVIGDKFFENDRNQLMLENLYQVFNNEKVEFQINSNKIQDVERLLIQITSFNRIKFISHKYTYQSTFVLKKPVQKILDEISSLHYQNLTFFKYVSELLPINPQAILFDLFEEFN